MVAPKREKMACQRSMTQKEEDIEREKGGSHVAKKRMIQERKPLPFKRESHIHPSTHTPPPFDRDGMTCFSMDHLIDFTIYGMQICHVLILP